MSDVATARLEPPRFVNSKAFLFAGLSERFACESTNAVPALWQRFGPYIDHVPGQIGNVVYGVISNFDEAGNYEYLAGVEVEDFSRLPQELSRVRIPAQRYAVFTHRDHISTIRNTIGAIWSKWVPESGHEAADAPSLERYDERFDPSTGNGEVEIWIPIKA